MSKLRDNVEYLGLIYKREIIKIVFIAFLLITATVVSFLFLDQIYISIFFAVGSIFIIYMFVSSYSSKRKVLEKEHVNEFASIISYFETFISNGFNVYYSLEAVVPFASDWMANEIKNLLQCIDRDKTIQPFIDFGRLFKSTLVENVVLSIYQMVDEGESEKRLENFYRSFEEMNRITKDEMTASATKSLETLNLFPLIGSGIIAVMLTFGIVTIIGGMMNVI